MDPKTPDDSESQQFTVGNDEDEEAEESKHWKKEAAKGEAEEPTVTLKPKYGLDGEDFENVWGGGAPAEPPKENP